MTLTAAGVATLLIVQDVLGSLGGAGGASGPTGNDVVLDRGLANISRSFDEAKSLGTYAWYGIERIGTAGGFRYIGTQDWYAIGARHLISTQLPDGSWKAGEAPGMTDLTETALAVLFLAHGRAPVLMGKLNYSAVLEGASIGSTLKVVT